MKVTYIQLDLDDKNKLFKLAQKRNLSVSTVADIIIKNLYVCFDWKDEKREKYIYKGKYKICLKLRNENKNHLSKVINTNCIYSYLHNESLKINWNNINRKIQSDLDKAYDPNYMKNLIIRTNYQIMKEKGTLNQ